MPNARQAGSRAALAVALAVCGLAALPLARGRGVAQSVAGVASGPLTDDESLATTDEGTESDFVRVRGTQFEVAGAPFRFVGANVAIMHGRTHRTQMEATLDAAAGDGLSVVRLWALGEYDEDAPAWADDYAFRRGAERWLEPALMHLDSALEACRARGLRAIVVLANRWPDYGGVGAYLRWALVPFAASSDGSVSRAELPRFYESEAATALYRVHVERVVTRANSVTGVPYRDDPTIFAWELMNELEAPRRDAALLVRWVEDAAAYIHALDGHHLVSAGHVGYSSTSDRRTWREVAGARGIDFADTHAYPTRFGEVTSTADLSRWLDDRAQLAHHVLSRPLVVGEVGFAAPGGRVHGVARRAWLDAFLRAAARDGIAGVLAWIYVPAEDRPNEHAILTTGVDARRTRDLRQVLSRHARRWARTPALESNPRLGPSVGETLLWDTTRTVRGGGGVHGTWTRDGEVRTLEIDPFAFDRARFESAGSELNAPVAHLWARGAGFVRYRFRAPRGAERPSALSISLRASSELPGPGVGGGPGDISHMRVLVDGVDVGLVELPVDDGRGRVVVLEVADAGVLDAIAARGSHTLELRLSEDDLGACLYGDPGAEAETLADEVRTELPGRIRLMWTGIPDP